MDPTGIESNDLARFREDGFLVCRRQLLDPAMLRRLEGIALRYDEDARRGRRPPDLNVPHFTDPSLFEFLLDSRVLDLVEGFLGPDIALWTSQFFCKSSGAQAIGWHSDADYWRDWLDPIEVLSIWLALDDASATNGCVRVVAGSHRADRRLHYERAAPQDDPFFPYRLRSDQIDQSQVRTIELRKGEFFLFDGRLVHGSAANESNHRRWSFTLRYMPSSCRFYWRGDHLHRLDTRSILRALRRRYFPNSSYSHQVYLARGRDIAGNRYTPTPAVPTGK